MENFASIFHHCQKVNLTVNGWYAPQRHNDKMMGYYEADKMTPFVKCPSGVTMEFITDAREISFDYEMQETHPEWISSDVFDIYENDKYADTYHPAKYIDHMYYEPSDYIDGKVKITIYLPLTVRIFFTNFRLGNWESVKAPGKKWLVIGDSIQQGLYCENPSMTHYALLGRRFNLDWLNLSVGGDICNKKALEGLDDFVPDIVTIGYGTNDLHFVHPTLAEDPDGERTDETVKNLVQNADDFYSELQNKFPRAKAVVIAPLYRRPGDPNAVPRIVKMAPKFHEELIKAAESHGFAHISATETIPRRPGLFTDGGIHPNAKGFKLMADALEPEIEKIMREWE